MITLDYNLLGKMEFNYCVSWLSSGVCVYACFSPKKKKQTNCTSLKVDNSLAQAIK